MVNGEFKLEGLSGPEVEKIAQALSALPFREVAGLIMKIDKQMIEQTQVKMEESTE